MKLSRSRTYAKGTVGLDIDGAFVAAVKASHGRLEQAASTDLPEGAVRDGEVVDREALAGALKDFFKDNDLPGSVRLGVANQQIVLRQIELPNIADEEQRAQAVRFQAAEAIAMPLEDAVLDYQVLGVQPGVDGGERMQVAVVAARQAMVAELAGAVRDAGLSPEGIDLDAFALVRALPADDPGEARVICHLGSVVNLAIASGNACLFTRTLARRDESSGSVGLVDEIRLSIDSYAGSAGATPVTRVVLSGPGSTEAGLAEQLETELGLPAIVAEPLAGLDASALPADESPQRHTVAAGLALGAAA